MKKILLFAAVLLLGTTFFSCGNISGETPENDSDSLALDSISLSDLEFSTTPVEFEDSLDQNNTLANYHVMLDVPQSGNPQLVKSVKEWLNQLLGATYEGELNFDEDMLRHYSIDYYNQCDADELFDGSLGLSSTLSAKVTCDTLNFICYEVEKYVYTGGAHGMPYYYGVTFDKETGSKLGWNDILADSVDIASLCKAHLHEYFNDSIQQHEVDDMIFDDARQKFPMPSVCPWIVPEGLKYVYGAYEIAPYAAGMPTGIIPKAELKDVLADKAKKLLGIE